MRTTPSPSTRKGKQENDYSAAAESIKKQGIYGEKLTLADVYSAPAGYAVDAARTKADLTDALGKNENFDVYLARADYTVRFLADLSEEMQGEQDRITQTARFQMTVTAPDGDAFGAPEGVEFVGWSETEGGSVRYHAGDVITIEGDLTLHAIWDAPYTDLFGGDDILYLPHEEPGKAVFIRAGVTFEGTVSGDIFSVMVGTFTLKGKLTDDGYFAIYNEEMDGLKLSNFYTYYDSETQAIGSDVDDTFTLEFDGYFGATLTLPAEDGGTQPEEIAGEYYFDFYEDCYCFLSDDEEYFLYFVIVSDEASEDEQSWFFIDSGEVGIYSELLIYGGNGYGFTTANTLQLDGIMTATLVYEDEVYEGVYTITGDGYEYGFFTIAMNFENGYAGEAFVDLTGGYYVLRDVNVVGTYNGTFKTEKGEQQATLELDGYGVFIDSASLYIGGELYDEGSYYVDESFTKEGFQIVVEFEEHGEICFFVGADEEDTSFSTLDTRYTEMYIYDLDEEGTYDIFTPVVVIYEKAAAGHAGSKYAEIWVYGTEEGPLVCAAEGYVTEETQGEETVYTFTRTALKGDFTAEDICATITFTRNYIISVYAHAIYTSYTEDGKALYDTFTSDEDGTLAILAEDESFYTPDGSDPTTVRGYWENENGEMITGTFYTNTYFTHSSDDYGYIAEHETRTYFTFETGEYDENGLPITYYFGYTYDEATHSGEFHLLDFEPYAFDYVAYETMLLDGEGGVTFLVTEFDEETFGLIVTEAVKGTYVLTDETVFGDPIYTLTLEKTVTGEGDIEFRTLEFALDLEIIYDESWGGYVDSSRFCPKLSDMAVLLDEDGNTMTLDGFAFRACYSDGEGNDAMGYYSRKYDEMSGDYLDTTFDFNIGASVAGFAVLSLTFDVYEDGTFAIRDGLEGQYEIVYDSGESLDAQLSLDGHGNVTVTQFDYETYENVTVAQGTYELLTDSILVTLEGHDPFEAYLYEEDYLPCCCLQSDENACVYTGADGGVLNILGNKLAYYTEWDGYSYYVLYYTFLSENIVSLTAVDAYDTEGEIVFLLDPENKTYTLPVGVEAGQCGTFLSADLGWFTLGENTVSINGQEYIYTVEGTNLVIFAEETISMPIPTGESFIFQGVTYYKWNGEALTFKGTGEYEGKTITFTPAPIEGSMFYEALLTFEDESKNGAYYINVSYQSWEGSMSYIIQSYEDYSVYQKIELHWDPTGEGSTFTVLPSEDTPYGD